MLKVIVAQMQKDTVEPYCNMEGHRIPVVVVSNHPNYPEGTRLDWGFVQCALRDGYRVAIFPAKE